MEALTDPAKLQLFLLFAVPGIIALYVRSQFLTGRMPPLAEGIIAYVTLSLIYQALISNVPGIVYEGSLVGWRALAWPFLMFILPAALGAFLGLNVRMGWTKRLLKKLGINTTHPVDAAWDWHFGDCRDCYILVALKDGTKWAGYLGDQSFMSSDPGERDIFIERVYTINDKTDEWTSKGSSVWIAHGEIQTLEFWPAS